MKAKMSVCSNPRVAPPALVVPVGHSGSLDTPAPLPPSPQWVMAFPNISTSCVLLQAVPSSWLAAGISPAISELHTGGKVEEEPCCPPGMAEGSNGNRG